MKLFLLCLYITCAVVEGARQIKLEDIERDNLVNERHSQGKENLVAQQSQHLRPPSILSQNQYGQQENSEERENSYIQTPTAVFEQQYEIPQAPAYTQQEYNTAPMLPHPTYIPQVHESDQTYTVPSRHSLSYPTIGGGVPHSQILTQQPQYVYVQAHPAQQQQEQQPQHQQIFHQHQQFLQQPQYLQQQPQYLQQQPQYLQQQQPQLIMFTYPKLPSQQYIQNIHQIPIPRPQITTHSEVSSVSSHTERPTISITSTVAPLANSQHQSVAPIEYVQSVKVQPTLHQPQQVQLHRYTPTHQYQYVQQTQQLHYPQSVGYNFDFFNNRHASSLLDSYIPSSVVLARQKGLLQHNNQDIYARNSAPSYSTISFSGPPHLSSHYKRSSSIAAKTQA